MKKRKKDIFILMALAGAWVLWAFPAGSLTVGEITQELTCTCGCNMVVSACEGAMDCSAAAQIKSLVMEKLSQGQSKKEILGYFVNRYGEKILSAPTKRGFNLTAWVLPFLALISGGLVLFFILRRWFPSGRQVEGEEKRIDPGKAEEKYLERFKKELSHFDY